VAWNARLTPQSHSATWEPCSGGDAAAGGCALRVPRRIAALRQSLTQTANRFEFAPPEQMRHNLHMHGRLGSQGLRPDVSGPIGSDAKKNSHTERQLRGRGHARVAAEAGPSASSSAPSFSPSVALPPPPPLPPPSNKMSQSPSASPVNAPPSEAPTPSASASQTLRAPGPAAGPISGPTGDTAHSTMLNETVSGAEGSLRSRPTPYIVLALAIGSVGVLALLTAAVATTIRWQLSKRLKDGGDRDTECSGTAGPARPGAIGLEDRHRTEVEIGGLRGHIVTLEALPAPMDTLPARDSFRQLGRYTDGL